MLEGASITRLEPWTDVIGQLHELQSRDGCLLATIGPVVVALPPEIWDKLGGLTGRRIAILRTDQDYRLRCLEA